VKRVFVVIAIAIACSFLFFFYSTRLAPNGSVKTQSKTLKDATSLFTGERLVYDVYFKKLKLGTSVLTFHGEEQIEGQDVYHITFLTKAPTFTDREEIYAYKGSFLPYRVFRNIKRLGSFSTKITEEYDQEAFKVKIKKKGSFLSKELTIEKEAPISNAILLPYYYRLKKDVTENETFKVNLPTVDFDVALKGEDTISTSLGEYPVHVFTSVPRKFTFWLSADDKRIPIKIEGHNSLGYSLVIKSIENTQ